MIQDIIHRRGAPPTVEYTASATCNLNRRSELGGSRHGTNKNVNEEDYEDEEVDEDDDEVERGGEPCNDDFLLGRVDLTRAPEEMDVEFGRRRVSRKSTGVYEESLYEDVEEDRISQGCARVSNVADIRLIGNGNGNSGQVDAVAAAGERTRRLIEALDSLRRSVDMKTSQMEITRRIRSKSGGGNVDESERMTGLVTGRRSVEFWRKDDQRSEDFRYPNRVIRESPSRQDGVQISGSRVSGCKLKEGHQVLLPILFLHFLLSL
ncbi:unnamed protein product [Protopolystoma xenopodis]|uniref:Uncharacterized protein n=1 Tax=Protopolystoma xenopodis TaxID=117903 RepID=A0A3S5FG21_9PLAT|nr:unnamed protein product [Protopolystoma xenopodis]